MERQPHSSKRMAYSSPRVPEKELRAASVQFLLEIVEGEVVFKLLQLMPDCPMDC